MRQLHSSEAGWKFRSVSGEKNSVQKRKGRGAQQFALESLESRCLLSNIVEYPTPKLSSGSLAQPAEITSAGGELWFTESGGAIGMVNPSNPSTVVSYPQDLTEGTGPQGITVGPDNNIWFTENGGAIGKLDTSNPSTVIQPYTQGLLAHANPVGITAGPQGDIWFTDAYNNAIGMLNPSSPNTITEISLPASLVGFTSFSPLITAGPGGKLYFTEANITVGSNGAITVTKSAIGIYDPSANQWSQVSLPSGQEPFGIAVGPDNQSIWYTWEIPTSLGSGPQSSGIGTFNTLAPPSTILPGSSFQLTTPSGGVTPQPNRITSGPDGELYLTDTGNGAIYSIDPTSHVISQPNFIGKTVISNPLPYGITTGPDGNVWFADSSGAVGRVTLVTAPAPPAPQAPPPQIQGATVLFTQKTNPKTHKSIGKPVLDGYHFTFNMAMNSASTDNSANYLVQTYVQVRVKVGKRFQKQLQLQPIGFTVNYLPSSDAVQSLTGKQAFKYGGKITLIGTGISSAAGALLGNNVVYNISAGGHSIRLA